jgi:hypothetical protein
MKVRLIAIAGLLLAILPLAFAKDVYVAKQAAGVNSGADCADARAYTTLSSSDWSAGNTVHLCGTITFPGGTSGAITFGGSGTAGALLTLKFETGASLSAPYWGSAGAISASGQNYIVVDGGTNGLIQATSNGTGRTNQQDNGKGIYFSNVSNSEIKNVTVANIYVHAASPNDTVGGSTFGICWSGGNNAVIDNNTVHDVSTGIGYYGAASSTATGVAIHHNTINNNNWTINVSPGGANSILSSPLIYNNNSSGGWDLWAESSGSIFHHDGILIFTGTSGTAVNTPQIYNNVFIVAMTTTMTGMIYLEDDNDSTRPVTNAYVFNNYFANTGTGYPADGYIYDYAHSSYILNNTIVGPGNSYTTYGTSSTIYNNIWEGQNTGLLIDAGAGASIKTTDYNDFYNGANVAISSGGTGYFEKLASWQASSGSPDAHSTAGNPSLDSTTNQPSSTSSAYHGGLNLGNPNSIDICATVAALCTDAAGNTRPTSGSWDIGAYQYVSGTVAPPSGVTAISQ